MPKKTARSAAHTKKTQKTNAFEAALEVVHHLIGWSTWEDKNEVAAKTLICALVLIESLNWKKIMPQAAQLLSATLNSQSNIDLSQVIRDLQDVNSKNLRDSTEFILNTVKPRAISKGFKRYIELEGAQALVEFVLVQKPCCQLRCVAWIIPYAASVPSAIPLLSHAAELLARLINDGVEPMTLHCTSIGNSWLHRLGVYLLHCCHTNNIAPPLTLVRLMSLLTSPSTASVKVGKAARTFDFIDTSEYPVMLHEAPAAKAIGKMLALEILDEFDANRHEAFFRKLERAVAFCAFESMKGNERPSIKSIQKASDMSWADAKWVTTRSFFSKFVFEHQCRHLIAKAHAAECPECQTLAANLAK